jgi:hypothetical protein
MNKNKVIHDAGRVEPPGRAAGHGTRRRSPAGWRWCFMLAGLAMAAGQVIAAEGMWPPDALPIKSLSKDFGFSPDAAWVNHVQRASIRIEGGCSASFVSPQGLILTNHHCVAECVEQLSTAEHDYIKNGFPPAALNREPVCPEIAVDRLDAVTDVTARIRAATRDLSGEAYSKAQKAEKTRIESECSGKDSEITRCQVVELYHGGVYSLYRYHRYRDVRLVFAPELAAAFFGGDPDNFNFPRYDLDMGLLRAYEDGKPAQVQDYLAFNPKGAAEGDTTVTVGNPGRTQRQLTVAQLLRVRDVDIIPRLILYSEYRGVLEQYGTQSAEAARTAQSDFFGIENALKAYHGELDALLEPSLLAEKQRQETAMRTWVAADATRKARYGGAWDAIEEAQAEYRKFATRYAFLEGRLTGLSKYLDYARMLVRGAEEREKPNTLRLREFTDSALPQTVQSLESTAPVYPALERLKFAWVLTKMREWLGADDPSVHLVLGQESPEALAERMIKATTLGDAAVRKQLWEGGRKAVDASKDPFIELARRIDGPAREIRKRYEDKVEAVETKNAELIAQARFEQLGTGVYPDATFTQRFSFGTVKGWQEKDAWVPPFTDFAGAFRRHTGFDPFKLPESWLAAKSRLDPAKPLDFVTTNDIVGGNSGSPVVNVKGEIVGLIFDGNIESLGGAFWYDERVNRAVAVDSAAILEALGKIYHADAILEELTDRHPRR